MSYATEAKPSDRLQTAPDIQKFADRIESAIARVKQNRNSLAQMASALYGELPPTPERERQIKEVARNGSIGNVEQMIMVLHGELDSLDAQISRLSTLA